LRQQAREKLISASTWWRSSGSMSMLKLVVILV
ncbi:hypothetical protein EE612_019652, partial [Oryza sativa]